MTRKHVQLLIFAVFITIASSISINGRVQSTKWNDIGLIPRIDAREENPIHEDYHYVVKNKKNISCILANMLIKVTVPYKAGDTNETKPITVPSDAQSSGTCSDIISEMKLTWKAEKNEKNEKNEDNIISFTFINDHTSFSLFSISASIYLDSKTFPGATGERLNYTSENDLRLFAASVKDGCHRCDKETKRKIEDAELSISNVNLIAFNKEKDFSSRKEEICSDQPTQPTFPYALKDDNGKFCSLAKMSASLMIPYSTKNSEVKNGTIKVENDGEISGDCGTAESTMNFIWTKKSSMFASNTKNRVAISFIKNKGFTYVKSIAFDIFLDEQNFPDADGERVSGQTSVLDFNGIFKSKENGLYSCENVTTINIGSSTMSIEDVLLVPFDVQNDFSTKTVVDCKTESIPSFNYVVKKPETQTSCILANMAIDIKVSYKKSDSTMGTGTLPVPSKLDVTGNCENFLSTMSLSWLEPKKVSKNTMKFHVHRNSSHFYVYMIEADIYLDEEHFSGAADKTMSASTDTNNALFAADLHNGLYICAKNQTIKMDDIELTIGNVAFIAFNDDDDTLAERTAQSCPDELNTTPETSPTTPTTESTTESSTTKEPTTVSTPAPDESVKKFKYFEINPETGVACTMANMTISLKITYEKKNSQSATVSLNMPDTATAKIKCDNEASTMDLIWTNENQASFDSTTNENTMTFNFKKQDSTFSLHSVKVSVYTDEKHFPDAKAEKIEGSSKELNLFSSPLKKLFRCAPQTSIKVETIDVTISDVALVVFNTDKSVSSRSEENCVTEEEGSNVGLIIGVCIACIALVGLGWAGVMWYMKKRRAG